MKIISALLIFFSISIATMAQDFKLKVWPNGAAF